MNQVHECRDNRDLVSLYPSRGLYLKSISRINVSVHYPELKQSLTTGGKSVSSWDIMSRVKALVAPEEFISLRVLKNTLEFIRFEGDLQNRDVLKKILSRLDGKRMKVRGFKEALKIGAAESKLQFPSKYDWDSFFRDAKNMNEMKGGERPDTIHFQNIPCKWFSDDFTSDKPLPSENIFKRVMETFGEVRCVDIPICDPYRSQITKLIGGINPFTNHNVFEAYVQYRDYMSFLKAMDALRGSFLFYQQSPSGKYWVANIKVDFDKSKHMSDESIRRRNFERDKLTEKDTEKKNAQKLSRIKGLVIEKNNQEDEKKESEKNLSKIEYKIEMEERKYLVARRKLEAIRLMDYLFETIKRKVEGKKVNKNKLEERTKEEREKLERAMRKYSENDEENERRSTSRSRSRSHDKNRENCGDEVRRRGYSHSPQNRHENYHSHSNRDHRLDGRMEGLWENGVYRESRYFGDWEVKAQQNNNYPSQINLNPNYVPLGVRGHPYPFRGQRASTFFRGGDRGGFRGAFRGRGGYPPPPHFHHPQGQYLQPPPHGYYFNENGGGGGPPPAPAPHLNPRHLISYAGRPFQGKTRPPFIQNKRPEDYQQTYRREKPLSSLVETHKSTFSSRGQRETSLKSPSDQKISSSRGEREMSPRHRKNQRERSESLSDQKASYSRGRRELSRSRSPRDQKISYFRGRGERRKSPRSDEKLSSWRKEEGSVSPRGQRSPRTQKNILSSRRERERSPCSPPPHQRNKRERSSSASDQIISSSRGQKEKSPSDQNIRREGEMSAIDDERVDSVGNVLVLHNFSYLEELDRAYEKYFTNIHINTH